LFGSGTGETAFKGIIPSFLAFLGSNPILLLPIGFYFLYMGIESARKLIKGY
jgi:hypothetical protein